MVHLFTILTRAVEGSPPIALGSALLWGILSVLLSPCHLATLPLIIGYVSRQEHPEPRRAFFLSSFFALGILLSIALLGGATAAAGRILGDIGKIGNTLVAMVFLVFGLNLMGLLPLSWGGAARVAPRRARPLSMLAMGLAFGLALGPCTFAYMAPLLGIVLRVTGEKLAFGLLLLGAFGLGHCAVLAAAGTGSEWVRRYLNWGQNSSATRILQKICGVLIILGGVYLIFTTYA